MESVDISQSEKNLIDRLKLLCNENGEEGHPKSSVSIFHDMAKIYGSKAKQKKLNAIRSVALYNAAIARDPNNEKIKSDLRSFCSTVLVKAKAKIQNAKLVKIAADLKRKLKKARKKSGEQYNTVTKIPDNVEGDRLFTLKRKKISDVQNMQKKVTKQYTELMRFVSNECIGIMGNPPCKYSVVGLGSLARSEITLYSDFEHIILLEDEAAWSEDRKTIMRYFKWFSTIFHIVLINLGETMIPSVAIPSLNGENSNWFYDAFTPNGVTFDGIMSHASKIPLGRQPTVNKPWRMELIKPVKEMLQLLEKEEDIKQGYHLADILSKSCFVSGEETLFHEYQDKSHHVVVNKDQVSELTLIFEQIKEDLQNLNFLKIRYDAAECLQGLNIKRVIYRSSTIFITAIGRLYSIKGSSCFDIIDMLEQRNLCSEMVAHQLRFMVAVACEIRFKVYHSKGRQDDIFVENYDPKKLVSRLIAIVEKHSFCSFAETVYFMQNLLMNVVQGIPPLNFLSITSDQFAALTYEAKICTLLLLGFEEEPKAEVRKLLSSPILQNRVILYPCIQVLHSLFYINARSLSLDLCTALPPLCSNDIEKFMVEVLAFYINLQLGSDNTYNDHQNEVLNSLLHSCESIEKSEQLSFLYFQALHSYTKAVRNTTYQKQPLALKALHYYNKYKQTPHGKCEHPLLEVELKIEVSLFLYRNYNYAKAVILLQECLLRIKTYKPNTQFHKRIYYTFAVCYFFLHKYYDSFICWLEVTKIEKIQKISYGSFHKKKNVCKTFSALLEEVKPI